MLPNESPRRPTTLPITLAALVMASLTLAAGLLLAISPQAEAQFQNSDIEVTVLAPDRTPTFEINTNVQVKVRNKGTTDTGAIRLTYYWNRVSTGSYLNDHNQTAQNQAQSTCGAPPTLGQQGYCGDTRLANVPAGSEIVVNPLVWWPSHRQQGQGTIVVTVHREADATQTIAATGSRITFVRYPKLEVVREYSIPPLQDDGTFRNPEKDCEVGKINLHSCRMLPGQTALFPVTVHNMGNFNDFFTPNMTITGSGLPPGWYVNLTPKADVPSNSTFNVQITAPRSGPGSEVGRGINIGTTENVKIFARSRANPNVEAVKIAAPHVILRQRYDLNVTRGVSIGYGNVSEPITFNFTVNNTGNGRDSFFIYTDDATSTTNSSWNPTFSIGATTSPYRINLNGLTALENRTVSLTVIPPPRTLKGTYSVGVVIKPNSTDDANPKITRIKFTAQVNQTFMISGSVNGATVIPVVPAETASFQLRVRNEGNGMNNVTLRVENLASGFRHKITPANSVLKIPAFGEATAFFNVTPDPRLRENSFTHVYINATAQGPRDLFPEHRPRVNFSVQVDVIRGSNIVVTSPETGSTPFVDPGKSITYSATIQNLGNVEDNLTFSLARDPEWSASTDAPELMNLRAGQTKTVRVTVGAPSTAEVGTRKLTTLTIQPEFYSQTGRTAPSIVFASRVSGPDLAVTGLSLNRPVLYTDLNGTLTVNVGNLGNKVSGNTTVLVEAITPSGAPRTLATPTLTALNPAERRTLTIDLNPGEQALEGTVVFRATIDPATPDNAGGLVVEIDEGNNARNITHLIHRLDLRVFSAAGQEARPGQEIQYLDAPHAFIVQNAGNANELVVVNISSQNGWGFSEVRRDLRPGERVPFSVKLLVPPFPGVKEDRLTFKLTMPGRADVVKTDTSAVTRLLDLEAPRIEAFTANPASTSVGTPTNLTVRILDATGISSAKVVIRTPLDTTVTHDLVPTRGSVYYYNHLFDIVGDYTAYVEAADRVDPPNKNTTRGSPTLEIKFTVKAGSAPTISPGVDLAIPVRSGTPIPLQVTDPLGVGKVTYAIEGVEYPTDSPYRVDTTGLKSGSYSALVSATNIYGAKGTRYVNFTVDNTAPAEPEVTLVPAKPKAGESATLTIKSDADAATATVVIKRNGLVDATREAERAGPGIFRLKFTPLSGEYQFDVVVRDKAGNSRTLEAASAFDAKTPGLGALAIIVVAGAASVILGRKRR